MCFKILLVENNAFYCRKVPIIVTASCLSCVHHQTTKFQLPFIFTISSFLSSFLSFFLSGLQLLCNSAIWQLTHFLIYAAQTLFYFPQNVVCIINFFFVKILLKFYIIGALKFKWPILSVKGNVTFFQFLYIFMFLWRCTSVLQCCYHSFHYRNKCCLCVLLNIEHIIKNITIESHTAHCLPYNS